MRISRLTFLFFCLFILISKQSFANGVFTSIRFNNSINYYPGATIGVQLELTGAFDIDNVFTLQMSDRNGDFTNPVVIATVNDFFTPIINGIIPAGTPTGSGYKLRVTSSSILNPASITSTNSFTVETTVQPISPVNISSPLSLSGTNLVKCFSTTIPNPSFGYLNRNPGDKTARVTISINNYSSSEAYTINVYNENQTLLYTLNPTSDFFTLREGDPVGYYVVEIIKTNQNRSTSTNFIYHFNTGNTSLGNVTNEVICVNDTVIFSVDANNMGKNYPGSKYQFIFGDDSPEKFFTHGYLINNPIVKHVFKEPTCVSLKKKENNGAYYFKTDLKLLNKGLSLTNSTDCNQYYVNGFGTTKWTNASQPPKADFTSPEAICINTPLIATNTSIPGSYGTALACLSDMISFWYIKSPKDQNFQLLPQFSGAGKLNLNLPASMINSPGCWSIKLEVRNADGCLNITEKIMNFSVEELPKPDFAILKDGVPVKEICINESVLFQDKSNIAALQCQKANYLWLITPSTGFTYLDNTNQNSANPRIQFTQPGVYRIIQQISNSCGLVQSLEQQLIVNGTPIVTFPSNNLLICKTQLVDEIIDFSLSPNRPTYSPPPFSPSDYTWTISGPSTDWEYMDGTNQKSPYPKIRFKALREYVLDITINGFCGSQNKATYVINLNQTPEITNVFSPIQLCSGQAFNAVDITTIIPAETINWVGQLTPINSIQGATLSGTTATIPGAVLTYTGVGSASLDYKITATAKGCISEKSLSINVQSIPVPPAVTSPVNYCINASPQVLQAVASVGNALNWYTTASGGTPSVSAPMPKTTVSGSTSYYVSQATPTNPACEGPRSEIVVNVNEIPSITGTKTDPTNCTLPDGSIILNGLLSSVEYTLNYLYNGSSVTSTIIPDANGTYRIVGLSGGSYINIAVTRNNCKSNELTFDLNNPQVPQNVTVQPVSPICEGNSFTLSATSSSSGAVFEWSGPGINGIAPGPSITITNALFTISGNYTLVANILGCKTSPIVVPVVINQTPPAPQVNSPVNYCKDATAVALGAGVTTPTNSLLWYRTQSGGDVLLSAPVPSTSNIGVETYYVSQSTSTTPACEGPRSAIVVNVYEVPSITGEKTNPTNCINPDGTIRLSGLQSGVVYTVNYNYNGVAVGARTLTSTGGGVIVLDLLPEGRYDDVRVTLNGCTSNRLSFLLENPLSPQNVLVSSNAPLCSGGVLELRASSTTVGSTFTWSGPAFTTPVEGAVQTLSSSTAAMSGTYNVVASIVGCKSAGVPINVLIYQTPAPPKVTSPVDYCIGDQTIPVNAEANSGNRLLWFTQSIGGTGLTVAPLPSSAQIGSTIYYVSQLTPTSPVCESERAKVEVIINPIPNIQASALPPVKCNTSDGIITLDGLVKNTRYKVFYKVNGVSISTEYITNDQGKIIIKNLPAAVYSNVYVSLKGCVSNEIGPFTLIHPDVPSTPVAKSNSDICEGTQLDLNSFSITPNVTYEWFGPNNFRSSLQNPSINFASPLSTGRYGVVSKANGCISDTGYVDVVVNPKPVVNLGPDLEIPPGIKKTLTNTIQFGPIKEYKWTPSTNLSCDNCPTPVAEIKKNISYQLRVTNSNGCIGEDVINIKTLCEQKQIFIPNAFTPESGTDPLNKTFYVSSTGVVTIKSLRIFTRWGELVYEKFNIPTNDPSTGWNGQIRGLVSKTDVFVYVVEVICENGSVFNFKGNVTLLR